MGCDSCFQFVQFDLEMVRIRRQHDFFSAGIGNEDRIFREEWCYDDDFIIGIFDDGFERNGQRCRSPAGHVEIIGTDAGIIGLVHILCQAFADGQIPGSRCITMDSGGFPCSQDMFNRFPDARRSRYGRIADTEIEYVFFTNFGGLGLSVSKQFTDSRTL